MAINYLAVLVCGVAAMVVGFVWYGPLFGKVWMEIMGAGTMTAAERDAIKKSMWVMYALQFVLSLITAGSLAYHITHWADMNTSSLAIAVSSWFGFVMTTSAGAALWSGKPKNLAWKMFFISSGAQLVTFIVFGLILGSWK